MYDLRLDNSVKFMKIIFEYSDHEQVGFDHDAVKKIVDETIRSSRYSQALREKEITLSLATVPAQEMRRVNNDYRGKDVVTDVISVGDYSDALDINSETRKSFFLGEVIVCWDFIQKSATIYSVEAVYEFGYVVSHGVLHLLGYNHGTEMFDLQDRVSCAFSPDLH